MKITIVTNIFAKMRRLIWLLILIGDLQLSGIRFGVVPRMDTRIHVFKIGLLVQNMITNLGLVVNIIVGTYMAI